MQQEEKFMILMNGKALLLLPVFPLQSFALCSGYASCSGMPKIDLDRPQKRPISREKNPSDTAHLSKGERNRAERTTPLTC